MMNLKGKCVFLSLFLKNLRIKDSSTEHSFYIKSSATILCLDHKISNDFLREEAIKSGLQRDTHPLARSAAPQPDSCKTHRFHF